MDALQFAYWFQGIAETNEAPPTDKQWQIIKDHLNLVFDKITPNRAIPPTDDCNHKWGEPKPNGFPPIVTC